MAMFTTPTRSEITPPSAPRMIGTASTTAFERMNDTGTTLPAASHPRSADTQSKPKMSESHIGTTRLRIVRAVATKVMTPISPPTRMAKPDDETAKSGTDRAWPFSVSWKVTIEALPPKPKVNSVSSVKAAITRPAFMLGFTCWLENIPGVTSMAIRRQPSALLLVLEVLASP